jgi:hypothetical protein
LFVFQNTGARPSSNSDHGGSDTLQPSPHQAPLNSCKQDDGKGEFNLAKFVYPYSFSFCSTTAAGAAVAAAARTVEEDLRQVTTTPARSGCRRWWWRRMAAAPVPLRRLQEESVAIDRSFDRPLALHSFVAKIVGGELAGDETVPWCSGRSSSAVCGRHRLRPPACI